MSTMSESKKMLGSWGWEKRDTSLSSRMKMPLMPKRKNYDAHLHALTKAVHTRLPREVRDMIYIYLLTPHEVHHISRCSKIRMDRFPYTTGNEPLDFRMENTSKPANPPHIIHPSFVYQPFAAEVLEMQYERYRHFWIDMPSVIPSFLDTAFLGDRGLNSTPRHARLSALHVSGHLDEGESNAVNLATLADDFNALSNIPWSPRFDLDITFRTDLGLRFFRPEALRTLARTMHNVWGVMQPWIAEAEEKRGARVYFVLLTPGRLYKYMGGEHDMPGSVEEWEKSLYKAVGGRFVEPELVWEQRGWRQRAKRRWKQGPPYWSLLGLEGR